MRGLTGDPTASIVLRGHAFIQNSGESPTNSEQRPPRSVTIGLRRSLLRWRFVWRRYGACEGSAPSKLLWNPGRYDPRV